MPELTVRHPDGSTETIPATTEWTRKRKLNNMRRARITVERSLANDVTLTEKRDIIELSDIDTLRLVDIETGGPTWTLVCYSKEWDANRQPFTAGGLERQGTDAGLIQEAIDNVPEWTAGTISSFTGPMSFVFNHAHEHDIIRRVERNTPGEIRFRDEGVVDLIDSVGEDKTDSVELSASAGTIEESIQITNRGRELDGTHIRVLGAHEGEAQISANLVPEDDPQTYPNEVRYSTPRWTAEEDTDWDRWENKDVTDQDTIEEEAAALGDELTESNVEAETTVSGVDIDVGDWVRVVKPDADLDRDMRVHRIRTVASGSTVRDEVLLSTRTTLRKENDRQLEQIRQFNTGFQGSSVAITGGPLEKAVDADNSMTLNFRYPDIEFENAAELHVRGLPYRIDSQGAAGGGDHTHEVTIGDHDHSVSISDHNHSVTISDHNHSVTIPDHSHGYSTIDHEHNINDYSEYETGLTDGHRHTYIRAVGTAVPAAPSSDTTESGGGTTETTDNGGGTTTTTDDGGSTTTTTSNGGGTTTTSDASGTHTHPPDPGIYTQADTPSNVDVEINGDSVATDIGSGTFETVININDEMTPGQWNDITLSSDSLGILSVSAFVRGYDQIGKTT